MRFKNKLIQASFQTRYKRFISNHKLSNGQYVTAHCPNTGSMDGLLKKNSTTFLSLASNPKRKLLYTWEVIKIKNFIIGINTHNANKIIYEALLLNSIKKLEYDHIKREVKYGKNSKIDFLLEKNGRKIWIEIKNVTFSRKEGVAEFPDSITQRGTKQLLEMKCLLKKPDRVIIIYLIQRNDSKYFKLAKDIDEKYYNAFHSLKKLGVETLYYRCKVSEKAIYLDNKIKIKFLDDK